MKSATAKEVEPIRNITTFEGLEAMRLAWAAVEEFGISLQPPRTAGGMWLAVIEHGHTFGDTPVSAVENLLREIGGVE